LKRLACIVAAFLFAVPAAAGPLEDATAPGIAAIFPPP